MTEKSSSSRPPSVRRIALDIICEVEAGGYCDVILGNTLAHANLAPRDAALLTRMAYGVFAWRDRLDWTLAPLARKGFDKLDPEVRGTLRLGLLQLLFLDRIPEHAAVSTSVDLARDAAGRGAGGLVNAILRRIQREGERRFPKGPTHARLAIEYSHPAWLVKLWGSELGWDTTRELLAANQKAAPTSLRVPLEQNRDAVLEALLEQNIAARAGEFSSRAIRLDGPLGAVRADPNFAKLVSQSEASLLVGELMGAKPGEAIVDLCAAPGGKTELLREGVGPGGLVVATDRAPSGVLRLHNRGLAPIARCDAAHPPFRAESFDAVLVDAPCSGLGTLRGHPEIRWRREPRDLAKLARKQGNILAGGASLVRPGGRLVYATCTFVREENEAVVKRFLTEHPEFQLEPASEVLEAGMRPGITRDGFLETSPLGGDLDGFFAARLRRAAD
jgi:16S rRNA (cytosine967-C5)-methyltransferase